MSDLIHGQQLTDNGPVAVWRHPDSPEWHEDRKDALLDGAGLCPARDDKRIRCERAEGHTGNHRWELNRPTVMRFDGVEVSGGSVAREWRA